jgi:hypothetical protein
MQVYILTITISTLFIYLPKIPLIHTYRLTHMHTHSYTPGTHTHAWAYKFYMHTLQCISHTNIQAWMSTNGHHKMHPMYVYVCAHILHTGTHKHTLRHNTHINIYMNAYKTNAKYTHLGQAFSYTSQCICVYSHTVRHSCS